MAGLGAGAENHPSFSGEPLQLGILNNPVVLQVRLIHHQHEGHAAEGAAGALLHFEGFAECLPARSVGHQDIASGAAQVGSAQRYEFILPCQVPDNEVDRSSVEFDGSLMDVYADGGVIPLREDTLHKPLR